MILTIISTLLGILSSSVPSLLRIWEKRIEEHYNLELEKLKYDAAKQGVEINKEIEDFKTLVQEGQNLREHDLSLNGSGDFDKLRASVRPIITFGFFFLFFFVKITAFAMIISQGITLNNLQTAITMIFDDNTIAIFSAVMGFWFGARTMEKFNETQKEYVLLKEPAKK